MAYQMANKAFKSDSQRLAVSLRSSIAKRRSHLNAALCILERIMNSYTSECKRLSISARAAIGLLIFERFCVLHALELHDNQEFLEHLWDWFLVDGPDEFEPWESKRPL